MFSQLSVYTLEGGGLAINGIIIAAYCNMFMIIMASFMMMSGVLLTALAYRPKEMGEEWWEWTERFYKSETSRVAGPCLIVISVLLILAAVTYCLLKRRAKYLEALKDEEESAEANPSKSINYDIESCEVESEAHLVDTSDIACFPDGSLRFSSRHLLSNITVEKDSESNHSIDPSEKKSLLEPKVQQLEYLI
eukprot:GFUD01016028.1.p1 GENE.GFUD01016028.1~~GFUD01016028.1.p1  ORF type:complete len:193 (+),score=54.57 GFUD01016028.1:55-633(+)